MKPSSETPATTLAFARLVAGLDLPPGILNIISGRGATLGETLVRSSITGMVTLTGSVEAGSRIIAATAGNITKCSLELGGKAPAIVCKDGDIDLAVKAIVASRVIFSGQVCNCAERVYVQQDIASQFMEKLVTAMQGVTADDPFADPAPDMSSQVSLDQLNKIEAMVQRAKKDGAEVLCGGQQADKGNGVNQR